MNKHRLFILAGIGMNLLVIPTVASIKVDLTLENLARVPLPDLALCALQCIAFLYLSDFVINVFDRLFSTRPNSVIRYLLELVVIFLAGFAITSLLVTFYLKTFMSDKVLTESFIRDVNRSKMIFADVLLITYACMRGYRFFSFLKEKEMEHIKWQNHLSHTSFEALKNQLNPHFLFNSLSVLTSLIHSDPKKADGFIGRLSKAYRYFLDQRDQELTSLNSELGFLKNFHSILSERFGEKVRISYPEAITEKVAVIPNTMILLLEEIIADNRMSVEKPLEIGVSVNALNLVIQHSQSPKGTFHRTDSQLLILKRRYEQVAGRTVTSEIIGPVRKISIPLIHEK
ncbi:MAG TPA: histidine kinase [Sphingobacteriaceae bacterium]